MRHFEKKNLIIFSQEGLRENVFPGPAVAFDGCVHPPLLQKITRTGWQ